jgi:hypothetical protein
MFLEPLSGPWLSGWASCCHLIENNMESNASALISLGELFLNGFVNITQLNLVTLCLIFICVLRFGFLGGSQMIVGCD